MFKKVLVLGLIVISVLLISFATKSATMSPTVPGYKHIDTTNAVKI